MACPICGRIMCDCPLPLGSPWPEKVPWGATEIKFSQLFTGKDKKEKKDEQ